ncbi:4-diphosphocytidyl-2-C-methyl-D-erythritol kinase [Caenispirillum salinarum AK4]|uniref:4-diphosphocytidyl-2-C-methyl-D-erythritol kinase n=1 Tax=Caenispirillum salinarum AK4 TaxID=1238182 RepID=K9HQR6_9PROT|nr:4-(cytidine 5'-diphospho)-2-C-methyl-D-erythritol kinase [Caenispirillum salinarum]EKV32613.1 4-diphosphocytidyl-2-C-methyl-D-erythritol kinase [Caenispirillum salinarum AK4]
MSQTLTEVAPAKVNLTLHVVAKRDDGYHLLDSLMAFAGIGDVLTAEPADALSLTVTGPFSDSLAAALPAGADNIVLKAGRRLADAVGVTAGAALTLDKRLPVAAGIGGGSADAAAALRLLSRLWAVDLPRPDLFALALDLGADVPVCLHGRAANVSGVGERLEDAPALPPAWLVLANPLVGVSTPAVFKARRGRFNLPAPLTEAPADARTLARALSVRANDLTKAAVSLAPEIGSLLVDLGALEGCLLARMSGSGATCWGLFETEAAARAGAARLSEARPDWWATAAPLLSNGQGIRP